MGIRAHIFRQLIITPLAIGTAGFAADVYFNDFNGPTGSTFPEWTSNGYTNTANQLNTIPSGRGPQTVMTVDSPNRKQRFLGEFGGPVIVTAPPYDLQHFVRVDETITLTLKELKPHSLVTVSFDLYVLKSWDGNNPNYGPDRWSLSVGGGSKLLDTTFSNNFKTGAYDLSPQNYPAPNSPPQTGAVAVNTLGYTFYGDSIYHLTFTFPHRETMLVLNFSSSMFEGKGTDDESWGLDNVRVSTNEDRLVAVSAASAEAGLAPESLASIYGVGMGEATVGGDGQRPAMSLGKVSVTVIDAEGIPRQAPLFYVSPDRIDFQVPPETQIGTASFIVQGEDGTTLQTVAPIQPTAPALFTANRDGRGVAAAEAFRMSNGSDTAEPVPVFHCGDAPGSCVSVPIDIGAGDSVYMSLFGTGIRGAAMEDVSVHIGGTPVPVLYVGAQPLYAGMDQVDVSLPATLQGIGESDLVLNVNGQASNNVCINIH